MSNKDEKKIINKLKIIFETLGYSTELDEKLPIDTNIDIIAKKDEMIYLIEVKGRNISNFDIINQSTISTYLKSEPTYEKSEINNVLITRGEVTSDALAFATASGVMLFSEFNLEKISEKIRTPKNP